MFGVHRIIRFILFSLILALAACSSTTKAPVATRPDPDRSARGNYAVSKSTAAKGSHIVRKGDTLYSIAWGYGLDYRDLANWNNINKPYVIYPKQTIRLKPLARSKTIKSEQAKSTSLSRDTKKTLAKTRSAAKSGRANAEKAKLPTQIKWQWPVTGKIIRSNSPIAKKGVDISGKIGQKIRAAATGDVVYSGSGLLGYGKLIIVKHNDVYLSAYAHNNKLLVKEGDRVKAGQQIATMGLGNQNQPILHFEIRKNGKPANPLIYLPKQRS